jgi:hypothetical protein
MEAMTGGGGETAHRALDRLTDLLVDDILNASDEDILVELKDSHGDPNQHASDMRALFEKTFAGMIKGRRPTFGQTDVSRKHQAAHVLRAYRYQLLQSLDAWLDLQ